MCLYPRKGDAMDPELLGTLQNLSMAELAARLAEPVWDGIDNIEEYHVLREALRRVLLAVVRETTPAPATGREISTSSVENP